MKEKARRRSERKQLKIKDDSIWPDLIVMILPCFRVFYLIVKVGK